METLAPQDVAADDVVYPKVKLDGQLVEIRFRCGDLIRLKRDHGIDLSDVKPLTGTADNIERTIVLLQAGVAHQMKATVEELANMVDLYNFTDVTQAVFESLKKVRTPAQLPAAEAAARKETLQ